MEGAAAQATTGPAGATCLTFCLGDEVFSLDIGRVREVLDYTIITRVPQLPDHVQGVINLRGSVVPVIDLRRTFGMPPVSVSVNTCIIIAEAAMSDEVIVLGLLADSVQEVVDLAHESVQPAPRIGMRLDAGLVRGIGRLDDRFIIMLDIDRVCAQDGAGPARDEGSLAAAGQEAA